MNSKLQFLRLEDITVNIIISQKEIQDLSDEIPKIWEDILIISDKIERKKETINLWKKNLMTVLPNVVEKLEKNLDNIELLGSKKNGIKKYFILYTIKDENERNFYYIGQLPENINVYNSMIENWINLPKNICYFYENLHNGFYHCNNRGMGLQPIQFTRFEEEDGGEWDLIYDEFSDDYHIDNIAFYRNNLGIALSINSINSDENNATIWRADISPKAGVKFWNIVDQLLLFF